MNRMAVARLNIHGIHGTLRTTAACRQTEPKSLMLEAILIIPFPLNLRDGRERQQSGAAYVKLIRIATTVT